VRKEFVGNGEDSFWAFCIEFLDGTLGSVERGRGTTGPKIDYRLRLLAALKEGCMISSKEIGHAPGVPGRQLEQQREQLPRREPPQQQSGQHGQQHRVPDRPQLRPTLPDGTMSMGLNRPLSRSHPASVSECDKMTKRPPGVSRHGGYRAESPGRHPAVEPDHYSRNPAYFQNYLHQSAPAKGGR